MRNKLLYFARSAVCFIIVVSLLANHGMYYSADTSLSNITEDEKNISVSNGRYSLVINQDVKSVSVINTQTGETEWNSVVTEDICDFSKCSDTFINYMQSMVVIHYALNEDTNGNRIDGYSADPKNITSIKAVDNGVDFEYRFVGAEIYCTLQVRLMSDGISFSIPFESVKEEGKYSLLSLEIAPFFGAAAINDSGYLFYPEGTGAITYFDRIAYKSKSATELSLDIYGNSDLETVMNEKSEKTAAFPVYGIKRGSKAFLAVITQGDSDAKINVRPAVETSPMDIHCAGFEFTYHYQYVVYLSNIVRNGKNSASNINGSKVDSKIVEGDRTVNFFFLKDENADYSGMANRYRQYLMDNEKLKSADKAGYDTLALTLLMGVKTEGELFGNNFVEMTTYSDALNIVQDYKSEDADSMLVNLRGWSRSGYLSYPQNYSAVWALGGNKGIKKLTSYLSENDIPVTLQCSTVYTTSGLFGLKGKSALKGTGIPISDDEEEIYLLSPDSAFSRLQKGYKKIKKYGAYPAFDDIGGIIYHNYNKGKPITRAENIKLWREALNLSEFTAVQNANAYVLDSVDWIYDLSFDNKKSLICDDNVPFVSMVLYNSIALTSKAGNYSYDLDITVLKWIEYGCSVYFELTEESPKLLRDTEYNYLFSSRNSEWKETVIEMYKEFSVKLSGVSDSYIIGHQILDNNLVKLSFENGGTVLLNYDEQIAVYDGKQIPGKSYLVY